MKLNKYLYMLFVAVLLFAAVRCYFILDKNKPSDIPFTPLSESDFTINRENKGSYDLKLLPEEEFDGLKKSDIYKIRLDAAKNSFFAYDGYFPNQKVFGQIEDGKPWYGTHRDHIYRGDRFNNATWGKSYLSFFVKNPDVLFGFWDWSSFYSYDNTPIIDLHPLIAINKEKREAFAIHTIDSAIYKVGLDTLTLELNGPNARDLGYSYIFVDRKENVKFTDKNGADKKVYKLKDFFHTGGSCGVKGGCNNLSPSQPSLDFNIKKLPVKIGIKLWNKEPKSKYDKEDAYYEITLIAR